MGVLDIARRTGMRDPDGSPIAPQCAVAGCFRAARSTFTLWDGADVNGDPTSPGEWVAVDLCVPHSLGFTSPTVLMAMASDYDGVVVANADVFGYGPDQPDPWSV